MSDKKDTDIEDRLETAYRQMMARAHERLQHAEREALPKLTEFIGAAREKAVELGELTREEAERVARYLERDVSDAAEYLNRTGDELADWLRFDGGLLEERLRNMLSGMVDHTRSELNRIEQAADEASAVSTGQVTAPGTLICVSCQAEMTLKSIGRVPPCPRCHKTTFSR